MPRFLTDDGAPAIRPLAGSSVRERTALVSAPHPAHREADIALRDGSTVHVRPIRPNDEPRLLDLLTSLSLDARIRVSQIEAPRPLGGRR